MPDCGLRRTSSNEMRSVYPFDNTHLRLEILCVNSHAVSVYTGQVLLNGEVMCVTYQSKDWFIDSLYMAYGSRVCMSVGLKRPFSHPVSLSRILVLGTEGI